MIFIAITPRAHVQQGVESVLLIVYHQYEYERAPSLRAFARTP